MKNRTEHHGTAYVIGKMRSSKNGNPRFRLFIAGFSCVTAVNSMIAFNIHKFHSHEVVAIIGTHRGIATLDSIVLKEDQTRN